MTLISVYCIDDIAEMIGFDLRTQSLKFSFCGICFFRSYKKAWMNNMNVVFFADFKTFDIVPRSVSAHRKV